MPTLQLVVLGNLLKNQSLVPGWKTPYTGFIQGRKSCRFHPWFSEDVSRDTNWVFRVFEFFIPGGKTGMPFATDTHYQEGTRVTFMKTGLKIAGLMFFPPNFDANATYPAIVFTHPGGGVKEQVASLYCWNLAQKGYVTLAFDASYQGESEGTPRHLEDPTARVDDIRAAIDYLTTLPYVDNERIGAMGVCAGGGYTMSAVQTDIRIKAAAGVCAWNVGTWIRDGLPFQGKNAAMPAALKAAAAARTAEANGGEPQYVGYVPNSPAEFTETTPTIMKEASDYYMTERCQYPTAVNKMAVQSLDRLAAFDAFQFLDTVSPRPILLIVGSLADTIFFSKEAYEIAKEPKELFVVEGATHVDLYDKPQYVDQAVAKLAEFFGKYL